VLVIYVEQSGLVAEHEIHEDGMRGVQFHHVAHEGDGEQDRHGDKERGAPAVGLAGAQHRDEKSVEDGPDQQERGAVRPVLRNISAG